MSYYEALDLKKEPFSTSPDPDFLYRSSEHNSALKRLEIAIRLRIGTAAARGNDPPAGRDRDRRREDRDERQVRYPSHSLTIRSAPFANEAVIPSD